MPGKDRPEWVRTAAALRPAWLCTQMSLWPARHPDGRLRGVPPDYRDQRMQFLQAIIHNAKGSVLTHSEVLERGFSVVPSSQYCA